MAISQTDYSGQRFGRLIAIEKTTGNGAVYWRCDCECGDETIVNIYKLLSGHTKSCGCLVRDLIIKRSTKHGKGKLPEYIIWKSMRDRCNNTNAERYSDYGGRGIKICKRWDDFSNFIEDMGSRPTPKHQMERIDNDKGYNLDNCKWATILEQANNKRDTRMLTLNGVTKPIMVWSRETGISEKTLRARIFRSGWSIEQALTTEVRT